MLCGYVKPSDCAVCNGFVSGTAGSYTDRARALVFCVCCVLCR